MFGRSLWPFAFCRFDANPPSTLSTLYASTAHAACRLTTDRAVWRAYLALEPIRYLNFVDGKVLHISSISSDIIGYVLVYKVPF